MGIWVCVSLFLTGILGAGLVKGISVGILSWWIPVVPSLGDWFVVGLGVE